MLGCRPWVLARIEGLGCWENLGESLARPYVPCEWLDTIAGVQGHDFDASTMWTCGDLALENAPQHSAMVGIKIHESYGASRFTAILAI